MKTIHFKNPTFLFFFAKGSLLASRLDPPSFSRNSVGDKVLSAPGGLRFPEKTPPLFVCFFLILSLCCLTFLWGITLSQRWLCKTKLATFTGQLCQLPRAHPNRAWGLIYMPSYKGVGWGQSMNSHLKFLSVLPAICVQFCLISPEILWEC